MSFLKFWKKGKKEKQPKVIDFPDGGFNSETPAGEGGGESVQERSRRSKHQLSISRSGRYKSKKRERGTIPADFQNDSQQTQVTHTKSGSNSSATCRELEQQMQGLGVGHHNQKSSQHQMAV